MNIFDSILLGIIQAIAEFLPISSSAHLVIFPYFLGKDYQGLKFDVMLHLGTLLAIVIFFFKDWLKIFKDSYTKPKTPEGNLLWLLIIATIPAGILGVLLEHYAEKTFRSPGIIGFNLIFFSIFIWLSDRKAKLYKSIENFSIRDAFLIGLAQSIALLPGASRSGMTIMAALFLGYKRFDSAKLSFLMATPIIFGAGVLELRKLNLADLNTSLFLSFISSFIFGIISIKFLLSYLKNKNLNIFIIYRIALGALILIKFFTQKN